MQSIIKALISYSLWYVIATIFYAFIGGGIGSYYAPIFGLVGFFFFRYVNQSIDWSSTTGCSYESPTLSFNYDLKNNSVKIKTDTLDETNRLPGGYVFGFFTPQKWVSTSTTARTSRGDTVEIPTGGFYADKRKTHVRLRKYEFSENPNYCDLYEQLSSEPNTVNSPTSYEIDINTRSIEGLKNFLDTMKQQWWRHYRELNLKQAEIDAAKAEERKVEIAKQKAEEEGLKRKQEAIAQENVRNQCSKLLNDWGIASEGAFKTYRYRDDDGGYICTMLAADKEGRGGAVFNDGKDTWSGSWKKAQVNEVGDTLEVQIDDPEYRKQNLKERRFVINLKEREERVEWIDRIRILSAQA